MPNIDVKKTGLQLRSLVTKDGKLELSLAAEPTPVPKDDEVLVRIEAAPINPSDVILLLGGSDPATLRKEGQGDGVKLVGSLSPEQAGALAARAGQSLPVGNEGAGTVVAAGSSKTAQSLLGKTVSVIGGGTYAEYRVAHVSQVLALPTGVSASEGAAWFVNPMTALSMVETMRNEGHRALVHTAAASNLGQMLQKICIADGVSLVNIVRKKAQAEQLRELGAKYVVDSSTPTFAGDLREALIETGATIAFDAVGGGTLANDLLDAMEHAASRNATAYSRYGSNVLKQVYIYGMLDRGPTVLERTWGLSWSVSGFLVGNFLQKASAETRERLRQRVASELKTTFASHYEGELSLQEALQPENVLRYARHATGSKFLIRPSKQP